VEDTNKLLSFEIKEHLHDGDSNGVEKKFELPYKCLDSVMMHDFVEEHKVYK